MITKTINGRNPPRDPIAAYPAWYIIVANPEQKLEAAAAAVCTMGLAGEIGWSYMQKGDGNSTYRNRIIDAIYNMTKEQLDEGAKYEVR